MDTTHIDEEYYSNIKDVESLLFSKELLNQIVLYEKTVELIGIIDKVEMRKSNLLKLTITNKEDDIVQILVWSELIISNIKSIIMSGNIIHIDGAFAKYKEESKSTSTCLFDLTISLNTTVRLLRKSPGFIKDNDLAIIETTIEDSVKLKGTIVVEGYIRNLINETSLPSSKVNQGSISDCKCYKLEVRMPIICDMSRFGIEAHVKVRGMIKYGQCPYLWVEREADISLASDQKKTLGEVLVGNKMPKRVLTEVNGSMKVQKFKLEK